jgi:protoporphyrin/coproporphyrin ferrochelatase
MVHSCVQKRPVLWVDPFHVKQARVPKDKYSVAFQSRLGRDPWLKPYTGFELPRLAERGVKRLLVTCPAFVSDCLETLEEIGLRGRESFLAAGGTDFALIPCLNEHPLWLTALEGMARRFMALDQRQTGPSGEEARPDLGHLEIAFAECLGGRGFAQGWRLR